MKFNSTVKGQNKTLNYENEVAYKLSPEWELYTASVSSILSGSFYENDLSRIYRIRNLIKKVDPEFVAKLAIYTREKMNLRSIPLVLAVELAKVHNGDSTVSKMVSRIVKRADEITELLAYYQLSGRRSDMKKLNRLSKQIQTGLQQAFNNFDEYQFAKYNRSTEIKLRDVLFLVHPKAKNEEQQVLFDKIVADNLNVPYTWETELSILGQSEFKTEKDKKKAFCDKWEELIDSRKLGYMALLRNLRNILEVEVSKEHVKKVCSILSNPNQVLRSKQLPFRFLSAYREISKVKSKYAGSVIDALEEAVEVSAQNISGFDEDTSLLIACDVSGSMQKALSRGSSLMYYDIGLMLAMLLRSRCYSAITGMFGDIWKVINVPKKGILQNVDQFYKREGEVGYSTNGYLVIGDLLKRKKRIDKVMIFTDMQLWNTNNDKNLAGMWKRYKVFSPESKLYLFDLTGYGNTPLSILNSDVFLISGWSDKIFDILSAIDNGENALSEIYKIKL